jgi:hypothetical protein
MSLKRPTEPPKFKPIFYEDCGCAILYFKENLEKIYSILKIKKNMTELSEKEDTALISRLLQEFSVVLSVSVFEGYCHEKMREIVAEDEHRQKIVKKYNFQDPTDCNRFFREDLGFVIWDVGSGRKTDDDRKLQNLKIFFRKRHCVIHRNSKVDNKLRELLNQRIAIGRKIPLDDPEIERNLNEMRGFVLKVENKFPSPVDWGEEGFKL